MTSPYSYLPVPARALTDTVARYGQATTSQLRRLHYRDGSSRGRYVRSSRHLKRLADVGQLRRVLGVYDGPQYVYMPPSSGARVADGHTLDVTELYVRLTEVVGEVVFAPEPWCHVPVGHITLKPDAAIDMGEKRKFFIEMDRNTEHPARLAKKMRSFISAWKSGSWEGVFPLVIWVCHTPARQRDIKAVIRRQSEPRLFVCLLFDDAVNRIIGA